MEEGNASRPDNMGGGEKKFSFRGENASGR